MRHALGFYPTELQNSRQMHIYGVLNSHVVAWLRDNKISGANAREKMRDISQFAASEARGLWDEVCRDRDFSELLPTHDACLAFVYASVYAAMGSFDAFLKRERAKKRGPDARDARDERGDS
jgi:hypothetical protein